MTRLQVLGLLLACSCAEVACNSHTMVPSRSDASVSEADAQPGADGPASKMDAVVSAPPIAIEDLCPVFTKDLCTYLMQCGGVRYRDLDHCVSDLDCYGMNDLIAANRSGAVVYDPGKVGACHARFIQSPCTFAFFLFTPDIFEVLSYCPGTLTPKLGAGGACSSSGECTQGLYCHKGASGACPGTCRAFAQAGESCAGNARCAENLSCKNDACVADVQKKAGDSCSGSATCNYSFSCPSDRVCPENIWCDPTVGTCQPGRLEGEACGMMGTGSSSYLANCAVHLWCDGPMLGTGVCRRPSQSGGPCNSQLDSCASGLHCSGYVSGGTSVQLGTCTGPSAAGGDCMVSKDCQTGLVCTSGKCKPPALSGETCSSDSSCAGGLVCDSQVCRAARYPGDACDATQSCTHGRCVNGTCQPHAKVGQPCQLGSDCATGVCVSGACYDNSVCPAP
jgi:hypothetical protein